MLHGSKVRRGPGGSLDDGEKWSVRGGSRGEGIESRGECRGRIRR